MTIGFVLQLDRAARMVAQHAVNPQLPGLEDVIDRLTTATFDAPTATPYEAEVRRAEERVLVDRVMWLAAASPNSQVRAIASLKLSKLAARLQDRGGQDRSRHRAAHADRRRHQAVPRAARSMPTRPIPHAAPDAPPGAPIGEPEQDWLAPPPWYSRSPAFSWDYWEERAPM